MIYMFKRKNVSGNESNGSISSICATKGLSFPKELKSADMSVKYHKYNSATVKLDDKVIVGHENTLYLYDIFQSKWIKLHHINASRASFGASMCNINSNTIIHAGGYANDGCFGWPGSTIDAFQLTSLNSNYHTQETRKCYLNLSSQDSGNFDSSNQYSKSIHTITCLTKLPISVASYSMINIDDNTVLLTGGITRKKEVDSFGACIWRAPDVSNRVFRGTLSTNGQDVTWEELSPLKFA